MGDDGSTSYDLAKSLHAFPHLNFSLDDVPHSNFNFSNTQYMQSLEVYCLSGVLLGVILFITFGFIQCCIGCRRCGGYNISYRMKQYSPILTTFLFLTTLGAMTISTVSMYYGVVRVQGDMNNISSRLVDISKAIDLYDQTIADIEHHVITLRNDSEFLKQWDKNIDEALGQLRNELDRDKVPDFHRDIEQLARYNRARELVTLGFLLAAFFACATLLIGICYGRVFLLHCTLVTLTVCMFLLCGSIGVYLSGAVASADICVEHKQFISYVIKVENIAENVISLFLNCKNNEGVGARIVHMLNNLVDGLETWLHDSNIVISSDFAKSLDDLKSGVDELERVLVCENMKKILNSFTQDYQKIADILCRPFLYHMCCYCVVTVICVSLLWLVINQLKPYADRVEEWMKVERLLDKAITITPDADETVNLIPDNTYPPPYNDYGTRVDQIYEDYQSDDHLDHLLAEQSLYQSLIGSPLPASHLSSNRKGR